MARRVLCLLAAGVALGAPTALGDAGQSGSPSGGVAKRCRSGFQVKVKGKRVCVVNGARCNARYEKQYERGGFKCINGRLQGVR